MANITLTLLSRELRGEIKLFALAVVTMATATAALTLVMSLASTFESNYASSARALLGGDASLRLSQREFSSEEREWLQNNSANFSEIRTARALVIFGEHTQVTRLKGVDDAYPLFGSLRLAQPPHDTTALFAAPDDDAYPAFVGQNLSDLMNLRVGDRFAVGGLKLQVVNIVLEEPDPDPRLFASGALVLVARQAMESEQFTRPGALAARHIRVVVGDDADADAVGEWRELLRERFPAAGWRVRTTDNNRNSTLRVVGEVRNFLALASLAALLLAGIGCGNALSAFLRARIRAIAVIKMVGGESALLRRVYLSLAGMFAIVGASVGAVAGMAGIFVIAPLLSPYLPFPLQPQWSATVLLQALATSVMLTAAFAVPPVLRFARVNPLTLFAAGGHEDQSPPPTLSDRLIMAAAFTVAVTLLPLAWSEKILLGGVAAIALLLYAVTILFSRFAERLGERGGAAWRLGLLAIARNRRQTAAAVVSFGVGVFVLTAIMDSENNFTARIDDTLRKKAPAVYLAGILPTQQQQVRTLVEDNGGNLRTIPFLRGRISAIGGRSAEEIAATAPSEELWVLRGDRAFTWTDGSYIGGSYVTQGVLWDDSVPGLQASFDEEAALAFGLQLGDALELNILGEPVTAIISSFREIEWDTFDLNFAIILSAAPFADSPHTFMGGAYLPEENATAVQRAIGEQMPNILPIATGAIFDVVTRLLRRAAGLLQAMAIFLMLCGFPMILATVIEHRRRRLQNAATLRLLGADRRTVVLAGFVEFSVMALLAVLPASLLGGLAGYAVVEYMFSLDWNPQWLTMLGVAAASVTVFLLIGATDIARTAKQSPLPLLRNE